MRALRLLLGLSLAGCAAAPGPCPIDASSWISTTLSDGAWSAPATHAVGTRASPTCASVVVGPMVSPDLRQVAWIEDRGDHRMFMVGGREALRIGATPGFLSLGIDGWGTFHVAAPTLQMFVHVEGKGDDQRWKATLECPNCGDAPQRSFDVLPAGPLGFDASPDGAFAFLTVPSRGGHTKLFVLASKTPKTAPTSDRYLAGEEGTATALRFGTRVWIGTSEGPVLDAVRLDSFRRDALGAIHYEGTRGNSLYDVVDNVLGPPRSRNVPVRAQ